MEFQSLPGVDHTMQTAALAVLVIVAILYIPKINFMAQLARLPAHDEKRRSVFFTSAKRLYGEGYEKFKNTVYRIRAEDGDDRIVIPPRFFHEVRKLPDSVISFTEAAAITLEEKYTNIDVSRDGLIQHVIKADLTPALVRLNPTICAEVDKALKKELPPCENWTSVYIYMKLANVVAQVSGRVFVGPEVSHNKEYLDCGVHYTIELMAAHTAIKNMHPILRPWFAWFLPEVRSLRLREKKAHAILDPIIQARRQAMNDPDHKMPEDVLQWLMNRGTSFGMETTAQIAGKQLALIFAAIHTTTTFTTNILYSLAVTPEYVPPLREEIINAIADNGGIITFRALQQMEKLDSYMKEVMRFFPLAFTSFGRKVLHGFTLSNGQYIPAGVDIETPSYAVYHDEQNYPNSGEFDGFRFHKLRRDPARGGHARNQFVTVNEQNMGFGLGAHACPGRFFAANEIKMILARLILNYDIKNADGATERYKNIEMNRGITPDPTKALLFKKVTVCDGRL
ncbi:cytochrome P450 monooxygenase-like protein [Amniculicola lignicola CBS 123094]|uniref:Cytochrome P450 monooxygenase-like protein n=1 Tax=Amniculicola lignicola CBS 123094 TaxID=1392246 RepID=A0A6A5W540_9PLEO|nr:cytochrome P450 monooxygenase-like protein [Amniculicola lignicola CBS 123094]